MAAAEQVKMQGLPNDLIARLRTDSSFRSVDLANVLNPSAFIGRAPQQVETFVREVVEPIRKRYPHAHTSGQALKV
jgi:adenylosuccinate lyase